MDKKQLYVFYEQTLVGVLLQEKTGEFIFEYDTFWTKNTAAFDISTSLPRAVSKPKSVNRREENDFSYVAQFPARYTGEKVKSYFSGLLPEGDVRNNVAATLEINPKSDFKLLRALGRAYNV